ncbi:MAG: hypothetical protein OXU20_16745 [Myxococcales bacterium]|nr:hypothetical protein [Myxococcales bacterium]MDD9966366.1 hypothetical protein [Myxococcales bacterium]
MIRLGMMLAMAVLVAACTGDSDAGGTAGGPAPEPELGHPCIQGCASGICSRANPFAGICSVECNSDAACSLGGNAGLGCFFNQCALSCSNGEACPMGTACIAVDGRMACAPGG